VDHLQNGHGRLIAASYCVRPLPGADPIHTQVTPIVHLGKAYLGGKPAQGHSPSQASRCPSADARVRWA